MTNIETSVVLLSVLFGSHRSVNLRIILYSGSEKLVIMLVLGPLRQLLFLAHVTCHRCIVLANIDMFPHVEPF